MHTQYRRTWNDGATALVQVSYYNARRWTVVRGYGWANGGLVAVEPDPGSRRPSVTGHLVGHAPGLVAVGFRSGDAPRFGADDPDLP